MAVASQPPRPRPPPPLTSSPYPFAAAPDIIRAHQKDAYFQGLLTNQLSDLHRRLRGARSAHAWAAETRAFADALYLCLTTLLGNRTLGEEYCDLVRVEAPRSPSANDGDADRGPFLPCLSRRAGLVATSTLLPYLLARVEPAIRSRLRAHLAARLAALARSQSESKSAPPSKPQSGPGYRLLLLRYLHAHFAAPPARGGLGAHIRALALAAFYFSGAYYTLSERAWRLRYVFTRRLPEDGNQPGPSAPGGGGGRAGYEVLGVLLVVQLAVRGWMHVREQARVWRSMSSRGVSAAGDGTGGEGEGEEEQFRERTRSYGPGAEVDVSLDAFALTSNNELLGGSGGDGTSTSSSQRSLAEIGATTHTPVPRGNGPRYDLGANEAVMGWIKGRQQRKCTLCLEGLRDPAATQCGHVFCWACIGDWVREKPECPLCRREVMAQHILPLRAV